MSNLPTVPQFMRDWELTVATAPDASGSDILKISSGDDPNNALRITFSVSQVAYKAFWWADVSIYNLNSPTEQKVLKQGMYVTLKAGYKNPGAAEIFRGRIFQPLWERENVVDYKITLHCVVGVEEITNNFINSNIGPGVTQRDLVARMASMAHKPISIGNVTALATDNRLTRERILFGPVRKYLSSTANAANAQWWMSPDGLNVGGLARVDAVTTLTYGPDNGMVGTPQVTEDGVAFTLLLDPRARVTLPATQLKVDMAAIRQLPKYIGDYPTILDNDGVYLIGAVQYEGDSRGNNWYAHVTGYTSVGGKLALLGETSALYANTPGITSGGSN